MQGVTFPAAYAMWGKWAPSLERSLLIALSTTGRLQSCELPFFLYIIVQIHALPYIKKLTLVVAGSFIGAIISFILSGVLCEYGFDGGWPSVFYIFGEDSDSLSLFQRKLEANMREVTISAT